MLVRILIHLSVINYRYVIYTKLHKLEFTSRYIKKLEMYLFDLMYRYISPLFS